jgi:hypothetical protein
MYAFPLPVALPEFTVSLLWHPRLEADAAHRWLRSCIREVCAEQLAGAVHVHEQKRERVARRTRSRRVKSR